jgi:serine protease Do
MKRTLIASASAIAVLGLGAVGAQAWTLPSWLHGSRATTVAEASTPPAAAPIAPLSAVQVPNYRAIVRAYGPAVVGVTVSGMHDASDEGPSSGNDPFFRFFRGLPGFPGFPNGLPHGEVPFHGLGSGFIISSNGVILTNAHVVQDAKVVTVTLQDRRQFKAKVVGSDPATDVAVIKIDAENLPTVVLGDPSSVHVGDYVLAIGAPYGFTESATQGIVSATGRALPGDNYVPFIQTDAAINPGNSGGPLFDALGRVIGINTQIYSRSGGFQGLAFAIPINVALHVKDQLVATGHVDHARLGVVIQDLTAPLAKSFGLEAPDGALVASVSPDTAAARADLKPGDVITSIDGKTVHTASDVSDFVGLAAPGDKIALTVWRDKSPRQMEITLGKAEPQGQTELASAHQGGTFGLSVRPLTPDERRQDGVDHGLLVEDATGPAALAGVRAGDVLLALDGKPVASVEQFREMLGDHPKQVALLVDRNGQPLYVALSLG